MKNLLARIYGIYAVNATMRVKLRKQYFYA